jgi:hypothetical protein
MSGRSMRNADPLAALGRTVEYLLKAQKESGEFRATMSGDRNFNGRPTDDGCVFVTALVLQATRNLTGWRVERMRQRACDYLMAEMLPGGVFRYWSRATRKIIEPDADDTACVHMALVAHLPARFADEARAALIDAQDEQGRFMTWLQNAPPPNDCDPVVNANVLAFLGDNSRTRGAVEFVIESLNEKSLSPASYYLHDASLRYAASRAMYFGVESLAPIKPLILVRAGQDHDLLSLAQDIAALYYCGNGDDPRLPRLVQSLVLQINNGDGPPWPSLAWYAGPKAPLPHSVWFGSSELTAALVTDALTMALRARPKAMAMATSMREPPLFLSET